MGAASRNLIVFVSSTSEDLRDYRAVARSVILDMHWQPQMMEHFGAVPQPTVQACYDKLLKCDLMLLIVAHRSGWVPGVDHGGTGSESITQLEMKFAREHGIPVLAMMADDSWPGKLWERDQIARDRVEAFRAQLNMPAVFFKYEEPAQEEARGLSAFRAAVRSVLIDHRERMLSANDSAPNNLTGLDFFETARDGFAEATVIPFVGHGVFDDGPLSVRALLTTFGQSEDSGTCLATAAEYRERFKRDRQSFLRELRRAIEEQTRRAQPTPVHDLLVALTEADRMLPLMVSATYDGLLETLLASAGRAPVVITHILHSAGGEHDGKILVLRPDQPPAICLSDQVELRRNELVVYKPLGSPLINASLDPDLEIDTVVITESDHLLFLGRLDNQGTGIPTALVRSCFRKHRLLFLGYTLDVWQFRLVMLVFELLKSRVGERAALDGVPPLAVRKPASAIEKLFWQRLNADLVLRNPNDFARDVTMNLALA